MAALDCLTLLAMTLLWLRCACYCRSCVQLPLLAYDAVTLLQRVGGSGANSGGVHTLVRDVSTVLDSLGISFSGIISNNTGILVNISTVMQIVQCVYDYAARSECHVCVDLCCDGRLAFLLCLVFVCVVVQRVSSPDGGGQLEHHRP